jgi:hypothetical protein
MDLTAIGVGLLETVFGQSLTKAKLVAYDRPEGSKIKDLDVEFYLNPSSITVTKNVVLGQEKPSAATATATYKQTDPLSLDFGEILFDTYETRENVRSKYIDKLERLMEPYYKTHHLPVVVFLWGKFTDDTENVVNYQFYVRSLVVTYKMFLPDGTPVRASAKLTLEQAKKQELQQQENPKQSPDHAKLYTVRRGDTLQGIAMAEYEDPREWRRIADLNAVSDPMRLEPGIKLLVPPILK